MLESISELSPLNERWLSDVCVRAALGAAPRQRSIHRRGRVRWHRRWLCRL